MKGTVRKYLTERHFGFITAEDGSSEVFFHESVFVSEVEIPPITGEEVEYELGDGTRAAEVRRLDLPQSRVGSISSYDPVRGYGFITCPDGQFYLHKSEVLGGVVPMVGSQVDFFTTGTVTQGKSPRACYVAVLR